MIRELASEYPSVIVDDYHVDAMAAHLVRRPSAFDVVVTENLFGDILSDLTGELVGSLGAAPSINVGDGRAMAQAAHGSAPDIAGKNIANPIGEIASTSMLLRWLGDRRENEDVVAAAGSIERALDVVLESGVRLRDMGGTADTTTFTEGGPPHPGAAALVTCSRQAFELTPGDRASSFGRAVEDMSSKGDQLWASSGGSPPGLMDRRLFLRLAGTGLAGAGITIGLGACGFGSSSSKVGSSDATTVTPMNFIQGSASLEWAPVQLATAAGYFKEFGVDPTVTYQGSGGTTTNVGAVLSGGVDAGGQVGSALAAVRAGGADIRIIGVLTNRIGVKVVVRRDVAARIGVKETDPLDKRIRALQGLKIGTINLGGGVYFALEYALRRQNIDLSKFATVTGIDPQDAIVAAMQSGRIDAAALSSPYGEIATQGGKAILLLTTAKGELPELQNQIFTCIYVRNNYANDKAHKDLLGHFMTALAKSQHVITTQPQTAKTHLAPLFNTLQPDVFAQAFADTGFSANPVISSLAFDDTRRYQEAASGKALAINFADLVDNTFATAAVANIKGK